MIIHVDTLVLEHVPVRVAPYVQIHVLLARELAKDLARVHVLLLVPLVALAIVRTPALELV